MINNFLNIVQKLEPELAHSLTLKSLKFIKFTNWKDFNHPSLNLKICNLNFGDGLYIWQCCQKLQNIKTFWATTS